MTCIRIFHTAEKAGFEPAIPFRGIHAFQACLFNHSSISPIQTQAPYPQNERKLQKKSHLQMNERTNLKFLLDISTTLRAIILNKPSK